MTDHEGALIRQLMRSVESLTGKLDETLNWINGEGQEPGAKGRIQAVESEVEVIKTSIASRIAWWQVLLCGAFPAIVVVIVEHFWK